MPSAADIYRDREAVGLLPASYQDMSLDGRSVPKSPMDIVIKIAFIDLLLDSDSETGLGPRALKMPTLSHKSKI